MNKVIMVGNIATDPESRTTQGGIAQCTFRLAVQRRYPDSSGVRKADFFTVVTWRQTAEFCSKYLGKGCRIAVEGSVQNRNYDAQDGTRRWVTEIIAENVEAVSFCRSDDDPGSTPPPGPEDCTGAGDEASLLEH